jgi:hypothetical protein
LHKSRISSSASKRAFALLLQKDLAENPAEEVDVSPERFVLGSKSIPGGRSAYSPAGVSIDRARISTVGRVTLPSIETTPRRKYLYIRTTGTRD